MRVTFASRNLAVEIPAGATLLDAARLAGLPLEAPCNGSGQCGKCQLRVATASLPNLEIFADGTSAGEDHREIVLACHALVKGDIEVESLIEESGLLRILSVGRGGSSKLAPAVRKVFDREQNATAVYLEDTRLGTEPGNTTGYCYGAAVDIGTTTVVVTLIDLNTGQELGTSSFLNPQTRYGHDVLSRIQLASVPEGLETLHAAIIRELNRTLLRLVRRAGVRVEYVHELVLSGNTCMLHLAAGVSPRSLGRYPYAPALAGGVSLAAREVGVELPGLSRVYLPPVISGFVGGDITAGILATGLHRESGLLLLVDVGTNGEMVLLADGCLSATSTAAGPAFEGMSIACGMRAVDGAIEAVDILEDGLVKLRTINDAPAAGICGSGLLDLVAACVARGVVDRNGRLANPMSTLPEPLRQRFDVREGKRIFRLTERIYLTQKDIRQVQLAKGAVRAGIDILLARTGLSYSDVNRVLIAGAFGFHLRTESLTRIGMLPGEVADRVDFVGNTSQAGAQAFLLDRATRREMFDLVGDIQIIELANLPNFEKAFIRALSF